MLPLSRASQYAIRAMAYLAAQPGADYLLTETIARELELPRAFLAKVLGQLSAHGHVQTRRGRTGGVRLSRDPAEISLHDVVSSCEPLQLSVVCALGQRHCDDALACPLHNAWSRLWNQALDALRDMSLVEVLAHGACHASCLFPQQHVVAEGSAAQEPGEPAERPGPVEGN